ESMSKPMSETLSVVVEREILHPPEKIWRALTQSELIEAWLMKNDFEPVAGHRFSLRASWGEVDGEGLAVEPNEKLSYSWRAFGLDSVVAWTLTPASPGTRVRLEQSGFRPDQHHFYKGAKGAWPKFVAALEDVVARIE